MTLSLSLGVVFLIRAKIVTLGQSVRAGVSWVGFTLWDEERVVFNSFSVILPLSHLSQRKG